MTGKFDHNCNFQTTSDDPLSSHSDTTPPHTTPERSPSNSSGCAGYNCEIFRNEPVHTEDPKSVHHPVPDRVRVVRLCRQTDEQHAPPHPGSPGTSPSVVSRPELSGNKGVSSALIPVCSSTNGAPGGSPFGSDGSYTPLSRFRQWYSTLLNAWWFAANQDAGISRSNNTLCDY